jgi:hypothetical protein
LLCIKPLNVPQRKGGSISDMTDFEYYVIFGQLEQTWFQWLPPNEQANYIQISRDGRNV